MALLVDVDPAALVRRGPGRGTFALAEYVNDRPLRVVVVHMSVALVNVFKTAMAGTCKARPELPLEASLPPVPARGGEALVRWLFEFCGERTRPARLRARGTRRGG